MGVGCLIDPEGPIGLVIEWRVIQFERFADGAMIAVNS